LTANNVELRRPIARSEGTETFAACPRCGENVNDSLGCPRIPARRLTGNWPAEIDADGVNVRGYQCEACEYVLAISPKNPIVDVADPDDESDGSPCLPIGAVFADQSKRPVIVPRREVR